VFRDPYTLRYLYTSFVCLKLEYASCAHAHSMTCVWTKLNVCREGLSDMLCEVWVGRKFTICHRMSIDFTFVKRHSIACIMFIFDVLSGWMNSPNLLSALDLNTSRYRTRGPNFIRVGSHCTNYGVHEPMSAAMREFNKELW
jgi:hypothetical protein